MTVKGTLNKTLPIEVIFTADLANNSDAYIDHYATPSNGSNVVFDDVRAGQSSTTTNTPDPAASRRFFVEFNLAPGDKGVLEVKQQGVSKAKDNVSSDDFWLFGLV